MYRTDNRDYEISSPVLGDKQARYPTLACSPRDAMQMAETSEPSNFFPTVTITLTTLLWPGKAH